VAGGSLYAQLPPSRGIAPLSPREKEQLLDLVSPSGLYGGISYQDAHRLVLLDRIDHNLANLGYPGDSVSQYNFSLRELLHVILGAHAVGQFSPFGTPKLNDLRVEIDAHFKEQVKFLGRPVGEQAASLLNTAIKGMFSGSQR
jgi:hypothetical protein